MAFGPGRKRASRDCPCAFGAQLHRRLEEVDVRPAVALIVLVGDAPAGKRELFVGTVRHELVIDELAAVVEHEQIGLTLAR